MDSKPFARTISQAAGLVLSFASLLALGPPQIYAQQGTDSSRLPQRYAREGVAVEFTIEPAAHGRAPELLEGTEATVRFKITDSNAGTALGNLRPAAWMDLREPGQAAKGCREKVQSFLQASFSDRPDIDLNSYFILALNHEPNISVIDPVSGFGATKLYTLVALPSPGEDWVLSGDKKRLYVSMPAVNQVAVVDTATWKVLANVAAGVSPTRVVLQHDEKYLWVGNDAAGETQGGVTVIDTATLKVAAQLHTGAGHHEIAFTDDDLYAFVTNRQGGTLSVVDVRKLARVKDLKVGPLPSALAFSPLGKTVYVANAGDGTVVVVGGAGHDIVARMTARPGLHAIRFLPGGRFGFVVNRTASEVYIFDAATNRLLRAVPVGPSPDQITFTKDFAYVRSTGSEFVTMIKTSELGKEGSEVTVNHFPAGQKAPQASRHTSMSASVVPAPEAGAVLVANPADQAIYYYSEGMAAPMGSFQNYRRAPRAVLVLDHSLSETAPGVYTTTVRLGAHGQYDVAFLLDSPRMVNCFQITVKENPDLPKQRGVPIKVEALAQGGDLRVGESYRLRFRVTDAGSDRPQAELKDMGVLVFLAPGVWQQRAWAKPLGDGVYEASFVPPQAGVYYIFFQSPSLGVQFNHLPFLTLKATEDAGPPKSKATQP
ncbi:MAG: YncE family protein [Acidobacteriota bacterium]|nr:YncE family protein [Acidobacteriota bacterium]